MLANRSIYQVHYFSNIIFPWNIRAYNIYLPNQSSGPWRFCIFVWWSLYI